VKGNSVNEYKYMNGFEGWHFICKAANQVEVWKTPTRYLVCSHYDGIFKFVDHQKDIENAIRIVSEALEM